MKLLRFLPSILVKSLLRFLYKIFSLFTIRENKITFASYRSDEIRDNLAFVNDYLKKNHPEYERVYLFKRFRSTFIGKMQYLIHMVKASYHLATSKYFIIDDYYFPLYVIEPRKGVEIIQLWHSAGAFKKFGLSTIGKPFGPSPEYLKHVKVHGNYSKVYVSSKEVIPYFADAFGMEEKRIYPLGIPRTDYFFDHNAYTRLRVRFFNEYPQFKGKKIVLYAPTFRGKSHYQVTFTLPFDTRLMEKELPHKYVLLIHLHPYMKSDSSVLNTKFTQTITEGYSIQELLMLTDILITDYSSVFFDFSLLERPIIFYPYDLEEYKEERDFYYDYKTIIPGPIATTTTQLVEILREEQFDLERVKQFKNRFFDYQDGNATERIVKHFLGRGDNE